MFYTTLMCSVLFFMSHAVYPFALCCMILQAVADFATLVATYADGFAIVIEPEGSVVPGTIYILHYTIHYTLYSIILNTALYYTIYHTNHTINSTQ
jgi:hypothetical protein